MNAQPRLDGILREWTDEELDYLPTGCALVDAGNRAYRSALADAGYLHKRPVSDAAIRQATRAAESAQEPHLPTYVEDEELTGETLAIGGCQCGRHGWNPS